MGVHHGAPDIAIERASVLDPVPGLIGLSQRGLDQILSIGEIAGKQISRVQQ
jgi:hypothetical protein